MSSFINNMQNLAIDSSNKNDDNKKIKEEEQKKRMDEKKDALMIKLTDLYHEKIRSAIERASLNGSREKYMNFNYDDFKANFPGMGNPRAVQREWLNEMVNPTSKYLNIGEDTEKACFSGLKSDIWGNGKFTTHFTW